MFRTVQYALVASLVLLGSARAQQWTEYRPTGEGYRIDFPGTPSEDVRRHATRVGIVDTRTSAMTRGDQTFMVVRSDYPVTMNMGDPQSNLDQARNGSLRSARGTLRHEERLVVNGVPARRVEMAIPDSNQTADSLLVMKDHRLIQAVYVGPLAPREAPDARRFLSSFALVQ